MVSYFWSVFWVLMGLICTTRQDDYHELPLPFSQLNSFKRRPGVFIEKWEGIDSITVSSLLKDSRYPNMATQRTYSTEFTQPENWGENYGSRIRTYFVPKVSGRHTFYISSDNEGQLWLSKDIWQEHKSKIAWVEGEHFVKPGVYDKSSTQKSWPIFLNKGSYYYMEGLMKEYYDDDHFSVAVQLPGQKEIPKGPITEEFLWTDIPRPNTTEEESYNSSISRIAAAAGATAGTQYGMEAGAKSAALTGAMAGRMAGLEAGAIAAQKVAAAAAREVFEKAFNTTLAAYTKQLGLDVRLFGPKGNNVSQHIQPTNTLNATNVFNVHINQHPDGQMSLNRPSPSYLPNTDNNMVAIGGVGTNPGGYPSGIDTHPARSPTDIDTYPARSPTDIDTYPSRSPSDVDTYPARSPTDIDTYPAGTYPSTSHPEEFSPYIEKPSNVHGSTGQVQKKPIYVRKPDYYRYHGPAMGLHNQIELAGIKKTITGSNTAGQSQDHKAVQATDGKAKRSWPAPIFTPLEPSKDQNHTQKPSQDGVLKDIGSGQNDQVLSSEFKKDGPSSAWPAPIFTPLEPAKNQNHTQKPSQDGVLKDIGSAQNDQVLSSEFKKDGPSSAWPKPIFTPLDPPESDHHEKQPVHRTEKHLDQNKKGDNLNITSKTKDYDNLPEEANQNGAQTGQKTGEQNGAQTGQQTGAQNGAQTVQKSGAQNRRQTGQQTGAQNGAQTGQQTGAQSGAQTGQKTGENEQDLSIDNPITSPENSALTRNITQNVLNRLAFLNPQSNLSLPANSPTNPQPLSKASNTTTAPAAPIQYIPHTPVFEEVPKEIHENSTDTNGYNHTQATREDESFVYYPKIGEDPDDMARRLVYPSGCASKIVFNAHYSIHSIDIPAIQINLTKNSCINSYNGKVSLRPFCQYFIIREGLLPNTGSDDISLESACIPDHFLTQRNYQFYVMKRDGTLRFAREATFAFYKTIAFPESLQIMSFSHYLWFVCETPGVERRMLHGLQPLILEYIRSKDDEFERCSFSFVPMPKGTDEHVHCKGVLDHSRPEIKGNKRIKYKDYSKIAPPAANNTAATCLALNFINKAGKPFRVYSDIKNNKYFVGGNGLKIKTLIKKPDLHNHVTYKGDPIGGNDVILLNGAQSLTVLPQKNCDVFVPVYVTSVEGRPAVKEEKHYHYHVLQSLHQQTGCPPPCSGSPPCPSSCSNHCCKRDKFST